MGIIPFTPYYFSTLQSKWIKITFFSAILVLPPFWVVVLKKKQKKTFDDAYTELLSSFIGLFIKKLSLKTF